MALASVVNSRPKASAKKTGATKAQNKKPKAAKNKATAKAKQNKTTTVRKISPAAIAKYQKAGAVAERARLRATGQIQPNKKGKKGKKKSKKNSSRSGFFSSLLPARINPSFRELKGTLMAGVYGLGGGGLSLIFSAILLAIGDRIAPTWTQSRWAQPITTFIAAIVAVPLALSISIFRFMGQAGKDAAVTGGVLFSLGQTVNEIAHSSDFFGSISDKIRTGAGGMITSGNATADAAANAVAGNGSADEQAAAASGALAGLRAHRMRQQSAPLRFTPRSQSGGVNLWGNAARS